MSKAVIIIEADDFIQAGMNLLKQHKIRMLPVTKKGKLVGVITDRDMKRAYD